jgi:hypothetical protein
MTRTEQDLASWREVERLKEEVERLKEQLDDALAEIKRLSYPVARSPARGPDPMSLAGNNDREQDALDALIVAAFRQDPSEGDALLDINGPEPVLSEEDERALEALGADLPARIAAGGPDPVDNPGPGRRPGGGRPMIWGEDEAMDRRRCEEAKIHYCEVTNPYPGWGRVHHPHAYKLPDSQESGWPSRYYCPVCGTFWRQELPQ